jgi:hypothetical protein
MIYLDLLGLLGQTWILVSTVAFCWGLLHQVETDQAPHPIVIFLSLPMLGALLIARLIRSHIR